MLTDDRIVSRVLKGRTEDYQKLMQRHQDSAFRIAYRIMGRREEAEDAVQEAFLNAYRSLASYSGRNKFGAWMRRIVINACLRKATNEIPCDDLDAVSEQQFTHSPVEAETIKNIHHSAIKRAIDGLPFIYRTVVVLRYMEDLSYAEIAEAIEEPVTTVQTRLHRAKRILNERLAVILDEV